MVTQISCFVPITFQTQLKLTAAVAVAASVKQVRQTDVYIYGVSVVSRFHPPYVAMATAPGLQHIHTYALTTWYLESPLSKSSSARICRDRTNRVCQLKRNFAERTTSWVVCEPSVRHGVATNLLDAVQRIRFHFLRVWAKVRPKCKWWLVVAASDCVRSETTINLHLSLRRANFVIELLPIYDAFAYNYYISFSVISGDASTNRR